jgi:predicted ArsR family transcriptional regulator
MDADGTNVRMTVAQAAQALGISAEAVRQRVRRGTLPTEKSEDGTVFVLIAGRERTHTDADGTGDGTTDKAFIEAHLDHALDEIRFLREELAIRNEELRRKDHIIAALTERIPEIEAPPEQRESPETTSEEAEGEANKVPEEERRPWWRRWFGA